MLLKESKGHVTPLVGSFEPFKGVSLDLGEFTPKCLISFFFSFQ